ncbi:DNA polymerase III subunit delta [Flavobacterium sp.]|uniref:DNA polymerase III subunit delta n=1 Tax=Flavobacterium sp. TaxID=239 RepID=UPI001218EEC8|nr:DNA polymerase III subunit delta [Flavobacterium sp.]RZJ72870.1 MAG: DNA polymerase III subunit delta [Flavobacterium sp.]
MEEAVKIVNDIKAGNVAPLYFLMGEEPYYIDRICDYIEANVLTEDEKGFNQTVVYGRDVSIEEIIGTAKRYPMMAEKQVVIVKEAQELAKTIDRFESYSENPTPTTVLVMCYKYKTIDKRKSTYKSLKKNAVLFESNKLRDYQIPQWIERVLKGKGFGIEPKASAMLSEFLGTDLGKISNELDKLAIILPKGTTINTKHIEDNIGFSKDFNVFELRKAIGEGNRVKAFQIAKYFSDNPKDNPMVVTTSLVFQFFSQLLQYHGLKDKKAAASALKINPYFVKDYEVAARNYPMRKVSGIVNVLRDVDVKSKGVGASLGIDDLLKEMLTKIFD